jgi:ATP-binding protein involved in chromosome partitioning
MPAQKQAPAAIRATKKTAHLQSIVWHKLLGIEEQRMMSGRDGIEPANAQGIKVASMALILSSHDSPVVWRGPMKMAAIKQFIQDVNWGSLDLLLIDLPPGTSDEPLSVLQLIPDLTGAIIVTTPQEV